MTQGTKRVQFDAEIIQKYREKIQLQRSGAPLSPFQAKMKESREFLQKKAQSERDQITPNPQIIIYKEEEEEESMEEGEGGEEE